jgi:hypothetical protein
MDKRLATKRTMANGGATHSTRAHSAEPMRPRLVRLLGGRSLSSDISLASAARTLLPQAVAEAAWSQRPALLATTEALKYPTLRRQNAPITRHTMPSNFRPISLKTNDGCTHKVTHFSGRHLCFAGRGFNPATSDALASLPLAPLHPREFPGSSLTNHQSRATNHGALIDTPAIRNTLNSNHSNAETISNRHGSRAWLAARPTNRKSVRVNLLSSPDAPRMSRLMTSFLDKRNFFEPSAPCWAFVFKKGLPGRRLVEPGRSGEKVHG